MNFKLWLEEYDLYKDSKKELRDEILKTLEPNKDDKHDVSSTRIGEFGSNNGNISQHGSYIIKLFNRNPRIWKLMAEAFPGEEEIMKNKVVQWLNESKPEYQVADLLNYIGIGDDPIVTHSYPKPKSQQQQPQQQQPNNQPQQAPAATTRQSPGLPQPSPMPGVPTF